MALLTMANTIPAKANIALCIASSVVEAQRKKKGNGTPSALRPPKSCDRGRVHSFHFVAPPSSFHDGERGWTERFRRARSPAASMLQNLAYQAFQEIYRGLRYAVFRVGRGADRIPVVIKMPRPGPL